MSLLCCEPTVHGVLLNERVNPGLPQVVLGPAVDGGFYLVGATAVPEGLLQVSQFGHDLKNLLACERLPEAHSLGLIVCVQPSMIAPPLHHALQTICRA